MILATLDTGRFTFTAAADTEAEAADLLRRAWAAHTTQTGADYTWEELASDVNYLGVEVGMVLRDGFVMDLPEEARRTAREEAEDAREEGAMREVHGLTE